MEILVYRKGSPKIEENLSVADLPELLKRRVGGHLGRHGSPTEANEQVLLEVFKFHPLTVEDCRENRHYPNRGCGGDVALLQRRAWIGSPKEHEEETK